MNFKNMSKINIKEIESKYLEYKDKIYNSELVDCDLFHKSLTEILTTLSDKESSTTLSPMEIKRLCNLKKKLHNLLESLPNPEIENLFT